MRRILHLSLLSLSFLLLPTVCLAASGSLLWQNYYDREGTLGDEANAVAVRGNRVFVVGRTETAAGGLAFTVRAYNYKGTPLWQNYYDRAGTLNDRANAVAVEGNKVFVVGYTATAAGGKAFTARAYNAVTGALLWQNYYDKEGTLEDAANAVAVEGNKVFVVDRTGTAAGGSAFTVRTYNITNGGLLWQNYYDREGTLEDAANAVAAEGNKVFVVGLTGTAAGGSAFTVRAFQR